MPGYNQQAAQNQARNANTVAILIGDQIVAFAQTVSHSYGFGTEQLYGVGTALPQEIQQMRVSPAISLSGFALTDDGIAQLAGGNNIAYLLANNQFNLIVCDGATNLPLFTYVACQASNYAETIAANQPVTQDIPFLALDVWDQNGNSVLNSGQNAITISTIAASAGAVAGGLGLN